MCGSSVLARSAVLPPSAEGGGAGKKQGLERCRVLALCTWARNVWQKFFMKNTLYNFFMIILQGVTLSVEFLTPPLRTNNTHGSKVLKGTPPPPRWPKPHFRGRYRGDVV